MKKNLDEISKMLSPSEEISLSDEDEVQNFEEVKQKKTKRKMNQKQLEAVKNNMIIGNKTKQLKKKLASDEETYENLTLQNLEKIMNSNIIKQQNTLQDSPNEPVKIEKPKKQKKSPSTNDFLNLFHQLNSKIDSFSMRLDSIQKPLVDNTSKIKNHDADYYKILADKIIGKK